MTIIRRFESKTKKLNSTSVKSTNAFWKLASKAKQTQNING